MFFSLFFNETKIKNRLNSVLSSAEHCGFQVSGIFSLAITNLIQ